MKHQQPPLIHVNLIPHLIKEHRMGMNVTTALQHLQKRIEILE
jgi:hypothetical protein